MTEREYNTCAESIANSLFRFIYKKMQARENAENIVQDTFESLWMNKDKVEFEKAKSWLFTAGYRKMIDQLRRDKKMVQMPEHINEKGCTQCQPDLKEIINNAMQFLPEIQRTVIMLRDYEGYDYAEIGNITDLKESQVKVYIFRARQTLKNYLVKLEHII